MFVSGETVKLLGKEDAKVIVCHIGNGAKYLRIYRWKMRRHKYGTYSFGRTCDGNT